MLKKLPLILLTLHWFCDPAGVVDFLTWRTHYYLLPPSALFVDTLIISTACHEFNLFYRMSLIVGWSQIASVLSLTSVSSQPDYSCCYSSKHFIRLLLNVWSTMSELLLATFRTFMGYLSQVTMRNKKINISEHKMYWFRILHCAAVNTTRPRPLKICCTCLTANCTNNDTIT